MLDNLKEGVIKPDLYEPQLNSVYAITLAHYGVVADPARVRDPNRKGTVENAIGHTTGHRLEGAALRVAAGAERLPGALGEQVGRLAHPWQRASPGAGNVRGGAAAAAAVATAGHAVLYRVAAHRVRRQLRARRSQQLRRAAGAHRKSCAGARVRVPHRDP